MELASDVCGLYGPVHAALTDAVVSISNGSLDTNRLNFSLSIVTKVCMSMYSIVSFVWEGRYSKGVRTGKAAEQ